MFTKIVSRYIYVNAHNHKTVVVILLWRIEIVSTDFYYSKKNYHIIQYIIIYVYVRDPSRLTLIIKDGNAYNSRFDCTIRRSSPSRSPGEHVFYTQADNWIPVQSERFSKRMPIIFSSSKYIRTYITEVPICIMMICCAEFWRRGINLETILSDTKQNNL